MSASACPRRSGDHTPPGGRAASPSRLVARSSHLRNHASERPVPGGRAASPSRLVARSSHLRNHASERSVETTPQHSGTTPPHRKLTPMDFSFTETQNDAAALAAMVFKNECTPDRLKAAVGPDGRFDVALWSRLGDAGLLGLCLPENLAGSGLGLLELCSVLIEAGRHVAPVPLATHLPT